MKIIQVKAYTFQELSKEIKEKLVEAEQEYRINDYDFPWQNENQEPLKVFCNLFNITWKNYEYWPGVDINYKINLYDEVLKLTGPRLAAYLWNNHKQDLYKAKIRYKRQYTPEGKYTGSKIYRSNLFLANRCTLTGYCLDDDFLEPIYKFFETQSNKVDLEELYQECLYSGLKAMNKDCEYFISPEACKEHLEEIAQLYTMQGDLINQLQGDPTNQ